jgi:hypothetical protein
LGKIFIAARIYLREAKKESYSKRCFPLISRYQIMKLIIVKKNLILISVYGKYHSIMKKKKMKIKALKLGILNKFF